MKKHFKLHEFRNKMLMLSPSWQNQNLSAH